MTTVQTGDFLRVLFEHCEGPVYFQSLSNDGSEHPREVFTRSAQEVAGFMKKWDRAGRGLFYCVATLKPDSHKRSKETVNQVCVAWADIDFKGLESAPVDRGAAILGTLQSLPCPPSIIVRSGHGLHPYWLFHEPLEVGAGGGDVERLEGVLRQLADLVGGDLAVCEVSRLMRLPGTHNTKGGGRVPVEVAVFEPARRYELGDLEDMLGLLDPVIKRKPPAPRTSEPLNPFLAAASALGFKPPLDVEAELLAMHPGNINATQLRCSASMLNKGLTVDEVVALIMEATHRAASMDDRVWRNWRGEERKVRKLCEEWLRKHPPVREECEAPAPQVRDAGEPAVAPSGDNVVSLPTGTAPRTTTNILGTGGEVVNMDEVKRAAAAKAPKGQGEADNKLLALMMAMVTAIREELAGRGERLMLTEGKVWHYQRGLWSILSPAVEQRIRSRIQHGLVELGQNPKVQTKNQVWSMLVEDHDLLVEDVRWNESLVVCENVVLELDQLTANDGIPVVLPHSPDHFARRRINAAYDEQAGCPLTLQWLAEIFADKPDAQAHIDVLQEFFGASLVVRLLPREARKAMMLFGPSNTGKSEVARLLRNLLAGPGSKVSATMAGDLGERFGMEQFYDAVAWICDEAGQVGEFLDAARFKVIVTGEPIAVERKNIGAETLELAMPVLLTMNVLPRVRDQSNAVFNRQINVSLTRVFSDEDAHEWRDRHETDLKPATYLFEKEGSGILVWALEGLHRLLRRGGHYDLPESMKAANREYAEASNPIQAWGADAVRANPLKMVARNDLLCAYHGFQSEMDGSEAKATGGRFFHPGFKDQFKVIDYQSHSGTRYWVGVELTDIGLALWDNHRASPMKGGSTGSAVQRGEVNRSAPDKYLPKGS